MRPKDRVAMIIASGIIVWGTLAIAGLIWRNKPMGESGAEVFVAIGGALVAMLATYFATNGNKHNGDK